MQKRFYLLAATLIITFTALTATDLKAAFVCGDADGSELVTISDAVYLINYIFSGGPEPSSQLAADADGSELLNISDVVFLINYIFGGGPEPRCLLYSAPPTTTILPESDTSAIIDYDTTSGTLTLAESSAYAQELEVGDIAIGQDSVAAPYGFLRKVSSKTVQGNSIVIETEPTTMEEAFEHMDISETHQLLPSEVESYWLQEGVEFIPNRDGESFNVSIDVPLYDRDGNPVTTDDQIRLSGNYAFTASLFADIEISWFTLQKFETGIETGQDVNLELMGGIEWESPAELTYDLAKFHLAAIPVGGVVWLVPTFTVEASVHGDFSVTFETGIEYTQQLRCGLGWANDEYYTISETAQNFEYIPPQFNAEFNFEPGVSLNVSCLLYGVAGPYVGGKGGFHFQGALGADPCNVELSFSLDAILYASVGIQCSIIGVEGFGLDFSHDWQLYTLPIGEWIYPLGGSGTIIVDPEPNSIIAPWTLVGPCNYSSNGEGDQTLTSLDPGEYTVTWGAVFGWTTPPNSTQTLIAGETATFIGSYVEEIATGSIVIDPSPDILDAPWSLAGPDGFNTNGTGDATLANMAPGDYTITWGDVPGWATPLGETRALAPGSAITLNGEYLEEVTTGTILVDLSPDELNAPWAVLGPDGYNSSGSGDATLIELEPGAYTVNWGIVSGWLRPPSSIQTVVANETTTLAGMYTEAPDSTGTVTDIDGNVYQAIKIGNQWWMMENLKVTHYRTGDPVPNVTASGEWLNRADGAYCDFDNNPANAVTYGRLYNWFAVGDGRNIAPAGWHIPTDAEWKQMEIFLGMSPTDADYINWRGTDEGGKLKETGTIHWLSPNAGATNESGFSALPGGYRYITGDFESSIGYVAKFWSSSYMWNRVLSCQSPWVGRYLYDVRHGFSIRCVRD